MYVSVFHLTLLLLPYSASSNHRFGYSRSAQNKWSRDHSSCSGDYQSPISIYRKRAIEFPIRALETVRYHDLLPMPIKLQNNGHSVILSFPKTNNNFIPYIFGALLNNEYELEGLHFHWGKKNNRGSEHVIDDIRYPMEMHIIHRNKKYNSTKDALENSDGLTVLAFFYQLHPKENKKLSLIVRNLSRIQEYDNSMLLDSTFPLASLMPADMDVFYTYKGSLTTPPCSEAVTWIVFPNALPISDAQMRQFRRLSTGHRDSHIVDNFRRPQKLGSRLIFVRKMFSRSYHYKYNATDHGQLKWTHNV